MQMETDIIKQMFIDEFPQNAMIKADLYQKSEPPFRRFRDGVKLYANVTRTNNDAEYGVSFFDSELDIDEIDRFIRILVNPSSLTQQDKSNLWDEMASYENDLKQKKTIWIT